MITLRPSFPKFMAVLLLLMLAGCQLQATPPPVATATPQSEVDEITRAEQATVTPTITPIPFPTPVAIFGQQYPSPTPPPAPTVPPTATPRPALTITTPALNIRAGPGLNYAVVAVAQQGERYPVSGRSETGDWFRIVLQDESERWVSAEASLAQFKGEVGLLPVVTAAEIVAPTVAPTAERGVGQGRLIFATSSGGGLYELDLTTTTLRELASGVIDPVVSPDGQQVAYTRWDGAEVGSLYLLDLASGEERSLLLDTLQAKGPTWSPDGQELIVSYQRGGLRNPPEICKEYDFDDGIRVPPDVVQITSFQTTADGITLCYIQREDLRWGLRRVRVSDGSFEDLITDEYSFSPVWDPTTPWRLIFDGDRGLMQYDLNTGNRWPLTSDVRDHGPVVLAPDGGTVALTYRQHDHWEVYTLNLANGQRNRLTKPPILAEPQYSSAAPAWSPDGQQLAFLTDRTGRWEIWRMKPDGSDPRPLFDPEQQAGLNLFYAGVNDRLLNWIE